jgi:hypothetical protein
VAGAWARVEDDGRPVALLPVHVWRCGCACHTEAGAVDLLGLVTARPDNVQTKAAK